MCASFKRNVKLIGTKWLRTGMESADQGLNSDEIQVQNANEVCCPDPYFPPTNQESGIVRGNLQRFDFQNIQKGGDLEIRN